MPYKADVLTLDMRPDGMIRKVTFFSERSQTELDLTELMSITAVGTKNSVGDIPEATITIDAIMETIVRDD